MFSFDSNGQFCMAIQGRSLFKNNLLLPGDNVSDYLVPKNLIFIPKICCFRKNFEYYRQT